MWSLPTSKRTVITSAGPPLRGQLSDVVTTEGIYWFDERYPGKPVVGVKHYRDFDRTLEARTTLLRTSAAADSRPVTFLTSKRTGLVSVYDVSRGEDDLVHMNAPSHCLPPITSHRGLPIAGWNLFKHPLMDSSCLDILHLSSRGDINRLHARFHSDAEAGLSALDCSQGFVWNDDVKELASASPPDTGSGRLTERESLTVNLGPAYQGGTSTLVMFGTTLAHASLRPFLSCRRGRGGRRSCVRCSGSTSLFLAKSRCSSRPRYDNVRTSNHPATHLLTIFLPETTLLVG